MKIQLDDFHAYTHACCMKLDLVGPSPLMYNLLWFFSWLYIWLVTRLDSTCKLTWHAVKSNDVWLGLIKTTSLHTALTWTPIMTIGTFKILTSTRVRLKKTFSEKLCMGVMILSRYSVILTNLCIINCTLQFFITDNAWLINSHLRFSSFTKLCKIQVPAFHTLCITYWLVN